jgi:polysaccharide export outer membrane protein
MIDRASRLSLALCCAVTVLNGCSGSPPTLSPSSKPLAVTAMTSLPPPSGADLVAATEPYRIGPYDKLNIAVFGVSDLSGELQTDAGGRLSMPLIGVLDAAGKTPGELAEMIAAKLSGTYVRDPQVTVNLKETTSNVFTIDGQVTQPGSYPVVGSMTLMRAVAVAKGAGDYARLNDVVVFRTVNGRPLAALYNLAAIRQGLYADPQIYPNDMVIVGNSQAKRLFQQLLQIAPLLSTPLILALEKR